MAQAKRKANSVMTSTFEVLTGLLAIQIIGAGSITFDVRTWAGEEGYDALTENGKRAIGHGMLQRLADRAALGRDSKSGKSATPQEKYNAVLELAKHYENGGEWKMKGSGPRPLDRAALYNAVATVRKAPVERVEQIYRDKADEVLRTLLVHKEIAAEYARLTTYGDESGAEELLGELDELDEDPEVK